MKLIHTHEEIFNDNDAKLNSQTLYDLRINFQIHNYHQLLEIVCDRLNKETGELYSLEKGIFIQKINIGTINLVNCKNYVTLEKINKHLDNAKPVIRPGEAIYINFKVTKAFETISQDTLRFVAISLVDYT